MRRRRFTTDRGTEDNEGDDVAKPKVYLAGKIAKNDWRSRIVPGRHWDDPLQQPNDEENGVDWNYGDAWEPEYTPSQWAVREGTRYAITGPFFVGCDHGCTHGSSTHATAGGCVQSHYGDMRSEVRRLCLDAIDRSHYVFAWLDDPTAHGTIAEIGYAAANRDVTVIVATPPCPFPSLVHTWQTTHEGRDYYHQCGCIIHGDTWFAASMGTDRIEAKDPLAAWDEFLERYIRAPEPTFDSDVERQFWDAHTALGRPIPDLVPQYEITANGKNYRLDFAIPHLRLAIEVDGLAFHNGQESFIKDRNRQRDLEMAGWRVLRFAAKEVMVDAQGCVRQAAQWAASLEPQPA